MARRRTGEAASQQIDTLVGPPIELVHVSRMHFPLRPIQPQGLSIVWFDLDQCGMMESGLLKAKSLTAGPRTEFDRPH